MLTTLGDAFKKDAGNVNNGYPVLVWQVSEACTDHTPGAAVRENEVPATCTKDGSHDEVIYCTICKTEISRKTITDKATGHKAQAAVKENVKDATCTAAGSHDEVVYCLRLPDGDQPYHCYRQGPGPRLGQHHRQVQALRDRL